MTRVLPQTTSNARSAAVPETREMRLAYLTSEYPKVSHTFIRREILELERRGHCVLRLAIRDSRGAIADSSDEKELRRTFHCLAQPKWNIAIAAVATLLRHPWNSLRAMRATIAMARRSERGIMKHLAYLAEAALLLRKLRKENITHVHVHFGTNAAAVARLIRMLGGPPYSMTIHGPNEFDAAHGFSLSEKIADATFVIAISDFCAAQIRRWCHYDQWHKIHIVRCTVGDEFFNSVQPIDNESHNLVCVGRLSAQKGHHLLIDAMRALIDERIESHLVFAGDGEMRSELERHIAQLDMQSHITITGWIDERTVRDEVLRARALVLPSFAEGLPVVIMESLAMGRPVISTMIAGIPELVRDNENGWLIAAGNLEELVNAMRTALTTPINHLNAMGAAGRKRVRDRHFTKTEVARLELLFDQYIACNDVAHARLADGALNASWLKPTQQKSERAARQSRQKGWAGISG